MEQISGYISYQHSAMLGSKPSDVTRASTSLNIKYIIHRGKYLFTHFSTWSHRSQYHSEHQDAIVKV